MATKKSKEKKEVLKCYTFLRTVHDGIETYVKWCRRKLSKEDVVLFGSAIAETSAAVSKGDCGCK